jgi:hypothetical protein
MTKDREDDAFLYPRIFIEGAAPGGTGVPPVQHRPEACATESEFLFF